MRTGNTSDGFYFFLLVLPFILSILAGELLRKKISSRLAMECLWSQAIPAVVGTLAEILIILTGISVGILLIRLV